jgi:acyl carrier protein
MTDRTPAGATGPLLRMVAETVAARTPDDARASRNDPDADLADRGLGSLTLVEIVLDLEARLGRRIPEELLDHATFRTERTIAEALASLPAPSPPADRER